MSRTTFVLRGGKLVEKTQAPPASGGAFFMPDIGAFTTQDGVAISSRSHLREYERARGVRQVGTDLQVGARR